MGNKLTKAVACGSGADMSETPFVPERVAKDPEPHRDNMGEVVFDNARIHSPRSEISTGLYVEAGQPPMRRHGSGTPRANKHRPVPIEYSPSRSRRVAGAYPRPRPLERCTDIWFRPPPTGEGILWDYAGWKDYRSPRPDFDIEVGKLIRILSAIDGIQDPFAAERMKKFLTSNALVPIVDVSKYTSQDKVEFNKVYWNVMHMLPYQIRRWDARTSKALQEFFHDISITHPCKVCRRHYVNWMQRYPVPVASEAQLVTWLSDLHNEVNLRTGKPRFNSTRANERWRPEEPLPSDSSDESSVYGESGFMHTPKQSLGSSTRSFRKYNISPARSAVYHDMPTRGRPIWKAISPNHTTLQRSYVSPTRRPSKSRASVSPATSRYSAREESVQSSIGYYAVVSPKPSPSIMRERVGRPYRLVAPHMY